MLLEIVPHERIGPIELGMTRDQVRRVAREQLKSRVKSRGDGDLLVDRDIGIGYTPRQTVHFIMLDNSVVGLVDGEFEEIEVFRTPCDELLRHIRRFDEPDPTLSDSTDYVFPNLGLLLATRSFEEEDERLGYFAFVGICGPTYLRELRRTHRNNPYEFRETPDVTVVEAERAAADTIQSFGGRWSLDSQGRIRWVWLRCSQSVTDAQVQFLGELEALEVLSLHGKAITDEGVAWLERLVKLKAVSLTATAVADATIYRLDRLTELTTLGLPAGVGTDGLKHVADLGRVECLDLTVTPQNEPGLAELSRLKSLRRLSLHGYDDVTDAALDHVGQISRLEKLSIGLSGITDAGLRTVSQLKRLQELDISCCERISDEGFLALAQLPELAVISAGSTAITDDGVAKLRQSLPDCIVDR